MFPHRTAPAKTSRTKDPLNADAFVQTSPQPWISGVLFRTGVCLAGLCLAGGFVSAAGAPAVAAEPQGPGAVEPLRTEFVYEAVVEIAPAVEVGPTPLGHRRYIPITGGVFSGPKLRGAVLAGGADWQIERPDGVTEADALYSIRMDDGTVVVVRNQGLIAPGGYMRTALRFTAPNGPHAWLNQSQFLSSIAGGPRPGTVIIRVFRLL